MPTSLTIATFNVENLFIDVALLSNYPIDFVRTHQFAKKGRSKVFPRDCLEVHINKTGPKWSTRFSLKSKAD